MPDTRETATLAAAQRGCSSCMALFLMLLFAFAGQPAALSQLESRITGDPENLRIASEYRQMIIASGDYERAIKLFESLDKRSGAGPHAALNLGLAYIDKIPTVGAFRRISIGNNAT